MIERGFVVLDFGSQVTQLIVRRLRELHYYSEILPYKVSLEKIRALNPYGIILSGGPDSVYEQKAPARRDSGGVGALGEIAPLLGICYGMQLIAHDLGGEVESSPHREYGFNQIYWHQELFGFSGHQKVWMSHGDVVTKLPTGFTELARSEGGHPAVIGSDRILAVQFHPEVAHTERGIDFLQGFCRDFCQAPALWQGKRILEQLQSKVSDQVKDDHVLVALSGGVDSSVVATLLTKTLGAENVHCLFVNNGLLRKDEYEEVLSQYEKIGLNVVGLDAKKEFLSVLKGVTDPEKKRKLIGKTFIEVFERYLSTVKKDFWGNKCRWLAQGTLYPDVIESFSFEGRPSQTIKSHHNVGGLPEKMQLGLVEPLRELFKDEVRVLGRELGIPEGIIDRHPFPGPGLAIRIIGEVTEESLQALREADAIFVRALKEQGIYSDIWQAFCVLLPVKTVGVQGDGRTYEQVLALRAVTSSDGMTADWYPFSFDFMREVSSRITNKVRGISRVVYDVTSKPPSTIEWE